MDSSEKGRQMYAALGVGFVCIIVGLPLWWKTTEVYRVQLPYSQIAELAVQKVQYTVEFSLLLSEDKWNGEQLSNFGETLKKHFQNLDSQDPRLVITYRGNVRHVDNEEREALDNAKCLQDLDQKLEEIQVKQVLGKYTLLVLPNKHNIIPKLQKPVVGQRRITYIPPTSDLEELLPSVKHIVRELYVNEVAMRKAFQAAKGAVHLEADKESMRSLRSHPGYEVTFTLLNPQPNILDIEWEIQEGISDYLQPLVDRYSEFVQLNVKSQVLHYAGLGVHTQEDKAAGCHKLAHHQLPHIINPIEAYLSCHVTNNPNLNFIVYVPTRDQAPLKIYDNSGKPSENNAFLSPRWGGILVYNIPTPHNVSLPATVAVDMRLMMEIFLSQFRLLLGVNPVISTSVDFTNAGNMAVADWELDQWLRGRALENVATAAATLRSLAQLLEEISNIVINDDIGREVERAVSSIEKSTKSLAQGSLKEAFIYSRQAILSSEKAFFDQSLLELLYFPEDQKFAIYIPLFLPIGIPILLSLIPAAKWLIGKEKLKTE